MTRIEIAKAIINQYKNRNKLVALATAEQMSKAMDILPSEECMFVPSNFTGWWGYDLTQKEKADLKAIMKADLQEAKRMQKVEYVTDGGEHLFTSKNDDLDYIVYDEQFRVLYRGYDEYKARARVRAREFWGGPKAEMLEVKESNRRLVPLAKRWQQIEALVG